MQHETLQLLRIDEVQRITGLRRSALYERIKDGKFPRPVALTSTSRAWVQGEVESWIASRIAARDAGHAA